MKILLFDFTAQKPDLLQLFLKKEKRPSELKERLSIFQ